MTLRRWMIYGAYGYSGRLIAEYAREKGLEPVLAGRNPAKTRELAALLGLEHRAFALDSTDAVTEGLRDIDAVVHCAGPFSATSEPMIEGCLNAGAHYFDITGEAFVFEHAHSKAIDERARKAGVIVCPGVGFDVVPTDCVAKTLAEALPDASELQLAFAGAGRFSPGTAKTMVEGLGHGTWARRDGKLTRTGVLTREVDFGGGPKRVMSISWGDISTAYHSTGIGNVTVYVPASRKMIANAKRAAWIRPLLKAGFVQNYLKRKIGAKIKGPDQVARARDLTQVWGEVRNPAGKRLSALLRTANGYTVTQLAPVAIVEHLRQNDAPVGSLTPSVLMGKGFAASLEGSSEIEVTG
ncbi:MAG: saccharopine dehydrogenase NADP-binding domain-containing protein [Pseudomonadota bacterium]